MICYIIYHILIHVSYIKYKYIIYNILLIILYSINTYDRLYSILIYNILYTVTIKYYIIF